MPLLVEGCQQFLERTRIVTPDANQVYWVSLSRLPHGPLPTFRGCVVNLPVDSGCDQHVATAAVDGSVAPLRVRFRLTPRTREYRVYRRIGDGPLTLFSQGAALYDPANTNKLYRSEGRCDAGESRAACYYCCNCSTTRVHGSPLALVGCKAVGALPRPIMAEPQPLGTLTIRKSI